MNQSNPSQAEISPGETPAGTPRTDARCVEMGDIKGLLVSANFARQLERELLAAQRQLGEAENIICAYMTCHGPRNPTEANLEREAKALLFKKGGSK